MAGKKIEVNWQELGVKYGDKLGIGLVLFFAVLLLLYAGLWSNPILTPEAVKQQGEQTTRAVQSYPVEDSKLEPAGVKKLEEIQKLAKTMQDSVLLASLSTPFPWYYDIPRDDNFKRNPDVFGPSRLTAMAINLPYRVYDRNEQNQVRVVKDLKVKDKDKNQKDKFNKGGGMSMGGGLPGMGGGAPGGAPGMGGGAGNMGGAGMGGGAAGGKGGGKGGRPGGKGEQQGAAEENKAILQSQWKDSMQITNDDVLAEPLFPARGVLILGAFPHKQQMLEIADALRQSMNDTYSLYNGLDIQRREVVVQGTRLEDGTVVAQDMVYVPDPQNPGKRMLAPLAEINKKYPNPEKEQVAAAGWEEVNQKIVFGYLSPIPPSYYEEPDPVVRSLMATSGRLALKLPTPVRGTYPDVTKSLPEIKATMDKIEKDKQSNLPPPKRDPRLNEGSDNDLFGGGESGPPPSGGTPPGGGKGGAGGMAPPMGGGGGVGGIGGGGMTMGGGGGAAGAPGGEGGESKAAFLPDFCFIRFLDLTLDVRMCGGKAYEYRVRVKLLNPNWEKPQQVSNVSFAKVKDLFGPWSPVARAVFPEDNYVYANERLRGRGVGSDEEDRVWVQLHKWLGYIRAENVVANPFYRVGAWWVDRVLVGRGEFIGRYPNNPAAERQSKRIPLPSNEGKVICWSAIDPDPNRGNSPGIDKEEKLKTLDLLTRVVLVDFLGGHRQRVYDHFAKKPVTREIASEILVVEPNGRMTAHNYQRDKDDPARKERTDTFDKWNKAVSDRSSDKKDKDDKGKDESKGKDKDKDK